jgi:hypothetical protein
MDVRDDVAVEGVARGLDGIDAEPGRPSIRFGVGPRVRDV